MSDVSIQKSNDEKMQFLKRMTASVYLCQILTFMLAGLPLLLGVAINFLKKNDVQGTWLESHFEWQIKTTWVALAGFALAGLTFTLGAGIFVLIITVVWMLYRIAIGWYALTDGKAIDNRVS
ncbi:DUF4870 family protein [Methylomonas rhizoryzae]|uniref:DUF4870 family protein n=1 Tax=Methylomonas rhizoryzae TaxID=2608981 RepID=UPI001232484E|nr:hypothetical protein [Methylomonas rhizoryzae]